MAINNQSDPEAVKRLREKVEGRKQSDPDAVQRLREKVLKENPDYKPSTPSSRGGAMSGSAGPMILGAEIAKDPVKYEVPLLEKRIIEESAYKPKKSRKPDSNQVSQGWSRASQYMPTKSDYDAMVTRTISDADAARDENDEHIINTVIYKNKYSSAYPQYIGNLNDEEFDRVYNEHFSSERPDSEGEAFIYDTKSAALKDEKMRRVKTPYDNAVSFLDQFTPDIGQDKGQNADNIVLGKNLADQLEVNVTSTDKPKRQREEDLDDNIVPLGDNPFDSFVEFLTDKDTEPGHKLDWNEEETPSELDELLRKESAPGADGVEYSRDDIYKNTFDFNKDVFATPEDKHYISTEERGKIINPEDVTDALGDLADRKDIVGAMPMDAFEDRFKTADQFDKTSGIYRDLYQQKYSYELEKLSDEELDELIKNNGHLDVIEHEFTPNQDSTERYLKEVKHLTPREVEYSRNVITAYNELPQREQAVLLSGASDTAKINRLISLGYDKETAERVVDYSSILVNEQEHQKMVKDIEDAGFLKLEGYNAAAFLTNLLSFVGQADLTYQAKRNLFSDTYRPVDYYTPLTAPGRFARETRKEKTERIDNEFLRNAYGLGTSMLDSALTMPLALLGPLGAGASRVIMSGSAGLNAVYDAKERGASDYAAVNSGIAASISEAMFESLSIGSFVDIFKKDAVESVLKKLVVQGFVEGSEETMTSLANAWADEIINGDKSEFNDNVKKYIEAGKSEEEAHRLALDNYIASLGIDFVGGFISGGIFGSAGTAINNAIQKHDKKRHINDLNKIAEKVGNLPGNEDLQLKPLTNNASEKEIESRKKEISDAIKTAENAVKTAETEASSVSLAERLDAMSAKNEVISVEDAKKATGFGDNGAKMVADLANTEGVTFSQAKSTVEVAYLAGFSNVDSSKVSFVTDTQIDAFTAGKLDRMMQDTTAKAEAANATVYNRGVVENDEFNKLSAADKKQHRQIAKDLGLRAEFVERILYNNNGKIVEANAQHQDGIYKRSSDSKNAPYEDVIHEGLHRMKQAAPVETGLLINELVEHAEQFGRRIELGDTRSGTVFDKVKSEHDAANISLDTLDVLEEIGAREITKFFRSAKEWNAWRARLDANSKLQKAWYKFVDFIKELFDKLKRYVSQMNMTAEQKAKANKAIAERERILSLYADAYTAAKNAVDAKRANGESLQNDVENKVTEDYNENIKFALKKLWHTDLIQERAKVSNSLKSSTDTTSADTKKLLDTIEHLKHEFERTEFAKADPKKLASMAKSLLKDYASQADSDEVTKAIDKLYQYMANGADGQVAVWSEVYDKAYDIAENIVENALVLDDYDYREFSELRNYLRTTAMKFDPKYDDVPASYENFNEFRKKNMGRLKFTKDGLGINSVYMELAEMYPAFFDAEEQLSTADMLERIVETLDSLRPMEVNPFSNDIKQASSHLASDIINRFFDIPQAKPTFADKADSRVTNARIAGQKKVDRVREQRDAKIQKLIESQREKTKKLIEKAKEARSEAVKKEKAKREKTVSRMRESQKAKVLRARIIRHAKDLGQKLLKPSDNQHIPQDMQGAVAKLLESINLESGSFKKNDEGLPTSRTAAFTKLKELCAEMTSTLTIDPDLISNGGVLSDVIALGDKRIADMTSAELNTVWQAIRSIENMIHKANKLFSESRFAAISELAEALRTENADKKPVGYTGGIKKLTVLDMMTPETFFHRLGDAGDAIFRMMRDAQDKHISIMKEVADFTQRELSNIKINKLEKTLHIVTLGGERVNLSTAQLMELYVLMKRDQAKDHIFIGGILPDLVESNKKKTAKTEPVRNITASEIDEALSNLTDEEKTIADKLQTFASTELSAYGNEASLKVYNYEKFLEKNYWPIRTNKQEIASDTSKDTAVTTVAGKGMAKGTTPNANTSVYIGSIFDTFADHSSDMATYAAWLGTSEDVNRIRNFVFWDKGVRTGTVKGIIDTVHGLNGSAYLQKLLTDIAIGIKGTGSMSSVDQLTGRYKASSMGANLRVVIQQPTAILRALDMIGGQYLVEGASHPLKGWEKAKKYAPIAQWKDWGYFDINTGRQMKDVLFDNAGLIDKANQAGMWGASMADSLSWGTLWNAVEAETKAKHKDIEVGSDEFYQAVAKRFTEIVDHTQVVDGILQRSQLMREADGIMKMATSFMGEPTKQYNMALSALYDAKERKAKAGRRLGRTAVALLAAGIINACAQSFIDALRDDDEEKDYWEKWLSAFGDNITDTVNPLNYVPFVKDVVSISQGYDVKRMDTESITKTWSAIVNMYKAVTGTGKYTIAEASAQLFAESARLFGLPVANVKRDVKSIVTTFAAESESYLMQYHMEKAMLNINYAGNSRNFIGILYNAYCNDKEAYEYIYNDMLKSGFDADKIQSSMEARIKKGAGVTKASELSKRYMSPDDESKYDNGLKKIEKTDVWKSANSEQRKGAKADLYSFITSTSEEMEKLRKEATASGVDATEYVLWQLASEMVDEANDDNNHLNAKEKAEAIEMLTFGNPEIAYFYGTEQAEEAYKHGIDMTNYALFKASVSGLKGDNKEAKVKAYAKQYSDTRKEYLFFMGTVYSSWKERGDYIKYFGKQEK